jgi:Outer membrane protein beta-barrel domain
MVRLRRLAIILFALFFGRELQAQSAQAVSLQLSGLYNGVFGNVFNGLKNGIGAEGQIRYTPGALSIGVGFQYTVHGRKPNLTDSNPDDARLYGVFFEPRYRIRTGSYVLAPYLSARVSLLEVGFSGGDLSLSSSFIQLNGGGGMLYRLTSRLNLDLGATYGYNRLGSGILTNERNGARQMIDASSGTNLVIRLGVAVGLGG